MMDIRHKEALTDCCVVALLVSAFVYNLTTFIWSLYTK